jgi:hypothetical protein
MTFGLLFHSLCDALFYLADLCFVAYIYFTAFY